ncbi:MAG: histone deacetylase [Candidatus Hydrogenedentes bacterium]|nr:histone deacetylase [Candidatus Hydrogenedentota bacterium]
MDTERKTVARTGLIYDEAMLRHDTGTGHPERPARLDAVHRALDKAALDLQSIPFSVADRADLLRVHTEAYVATVERMCAAGSGYLDPDTPVVAASWKAALLAAGGSIAACRAVLDKTIDNAFCAIRPPGHHAEADHAMGFCLFNNVAIAARWLQRQGGVKRVAIVDWDIHHGNGTQHTFYEDDSVYYVSLHQHPLYPGTGRASERGRNNTNLNLPFPPGTPPEAWVEAVDAKVMPELKRFEPDFLLISSGFDAHHDDPLGSQRLEAVHYAEMTRLVRSLADGRIVSLLEGGYNLNALAESATAHVRALRS